MSDKVFTREEAREIAREAWRIGAQLCSDADAIANRLVPEPPPAFTYGREVATDQGLMRRRSDGEWQIASDRRGWTRSLNALSSDAMARQLAAEVPLTDKECEAIGESVDWTGDMRAYCDRIRAAVQAVLRGEVKP